MRAHVPEVLRAVGAEVRTEQLSDREPLSGCQRLHTCSIPLGYEVVVGRRSDWRVTDAREVFVGEDVWVVRQLYRQVYVRSWARGRGRKNKNGTTFFLYIKI